MIRLSRLRDLPRRRLPAGAGHTREIVASQDEDQGRSWILQLVELRGPAGSLTLRGDATHLLAGLGGPQVSVGPRALALRREDVLTCVGSSIELHRPDLPVPKLSRIVVLSSVGSAPTLAFSGIHGTAELPERTHAVIVRSGWAGVAGTVAGSMDALVLGEDHARIVTAADARLLVVSG